MTFVNRPTVSVLMRCLCFLVLLVPLGCDDGDDPVAVTEMETEIEIAYDFVTDRDFPPDSGDRESLSAFEFTKSGITVRATADNEDGMPANVSRRGPGGLGIVGNGGMEPDGGTTSGNRINNGEALVLEILDAAGNPVSVQLVGATFSRIKQLGALETGFEIIADNNGVFAVEVEGTLDADSDEFVGMVDEDENVIIDITDVDLFGDTFTITNGRPFNPTGNRFRVGGITILVKE